VTTIVVAAILQAVEIEPTMPPSSFIVIGGNEAAAIRAEIADRGAMGKASGFGSVRVTAHVGDSRWQTSLFPHKESGGFFLPIKAPVRRAEGLVPGETISATIIIEK
jgi:hypothetical protein